MGHSIEPIPAVERYFGVRGVIPVIAQEFAPATGWVTQHYAKRVSRAWLRKRKAAGVTSVALRCGQRPAADFTVNELLRSGAGGYCS